jgi:nitric oxide reductase subunit C
MPWTRRVLWAGTILCSIAFLFLSVDSLRRMPARTHSDQLTAQVVEGKRIWQHYNCNDCHTILGIGGYYAPDVTKSHAIRGEAWLRKFLADPHSMYPTGRQMPNFQFNEAQVSSLVAYLGWVSQIDTNNWPPQPMVTASKTEPAGYRIFLTQHCNVCHAIQGQGGNIGPDLTHVASRRSEEWVLEQLNDPRSHYPNSVMPSFAKLPDVEKHELAEYLASLK